MRNSAKLLFKEPIYSRSDLENRPRTTAISYIRQPGISALLHGQGQGARNARRQVPDSAYRFIASSVHHSDGRNIFGLYSALI
jgi:hypothetical protein